MTTFTVWKFEDTDGADQAMEILNQAQHDKIVNVVEHAVVRWPEGADKPDTDLGHDDRNRAMGWGGLIGVVIGMLFFVPIVGGLVGAAIAAASKATEGTGIGKKELERIRAEVTPGTSALFLVTEDADLDRLGERFHRMNWTLISTNLTEEERKTVFETFGGS